MKELFCGMFGPVAAGLCRMSMNGKTAIKTSSGYKTYDVEKQRLTNCDSFVFDVGEDMFFVIPTNKVQRGDIILAGGKPRCVIEAEPNAIKTFCYEDGTLETIVPERHIFMGKQYFYGKIVSMFGNMMTGAKGMGNMFKYMALNKMLNRSSTMDNNVFGGGGNNMLPMLMMMNGGGGGLFEGMFEFDDDGEDIPEEEGEEK